MGKLWRVVLVLALLIGAAACGRGDTDAPRAKPAPAGPHALFKAPLSTQFAAARAATEETGSSHFTSTLTYGSSKGDIVEQTEGDQDYTAMTASADRAFTMPKAHPAELLKALGESARDSRQSMVITGEGVLFRTSTGRWLNYSSTQSQEFAKDAGEMLGRAGEAAPYTSPLNDLVSRVSPETAPKVLPDGTRRYTEEGGVNALIDVLPPGLGTVVEAVGPPTVPVTVDIDAQGHFRRIEADLGPLLGALKETAPGLYGGIRTLRAEYTLTGFGTSAPAGAPASGAIDQAHQVLVPARSVKPGLCGGVDTGLGLPRLVRPVPCTGKHDIRVFAQLNLDKEVAAKDADPMRVAGEECERAYDRAPRGWTGEATEQGYYSWLGHNESTGSSASGGTSVRGEFTCYVVTS
ncbi:hypothetical protein [Streptomyces sp. NPDC051561]|uniref:hypothetical protein n=1 Tax=Streptomyces sp. NPDC051561 TaxID=3365658 RepID=UPI0037B6123A